MNDQQLQLLFLGIIAICMLLIMMGIIFAIIKLVKTMNKANEFIDLSQNELSNLSSNLSVITKESSDLLKKVADESQFLTFKASNGITNVTNATLAFKAFSQFFKKNPEIKEDDMNKKNLLSFTIGAAVAGIGAYYVYKNKDVISKKINTLEETLVDDYEDLVIKAKEKLEGLTKTFQATAEEFLHGGTVDDIKEKEIKQLVKKLEKLQKEIASLDVKN